MAFDGWDCEARAPVDLPVTIEPAEDRLKVTVAKAQDRVSRNPNAWVFPSVRMLSRGPD